MGAYRVCNTFLVSWYTSVQSRSGAESNKIIGRFDAIFLVRCYLYKFQKKPRLKLKKNKMGEYYLKHKNGYTIYKTKINRVLLRIDQEIILNTVFKILNFNEQYSIVNTTCFKSYFKICWLKFGQYIRTGKIWTNIIFHTPGVSFLTTLLEFSVKKSIFGTEFVISVKKSNILGKKFVKKRTITKSVLKKAHLVYLLFPLQKVLALWPLEH